MTHHRLTPLDLIRKKKIDVYSHLTLGSQIGGTISTMCISLGVNRDSAVVSNVGDSDIRCERLAWGTCSVWQCRDLVYCISTVGSVTCHRRP